MESVVDFVRNQIVLEVIGREGLRFLPYLTTLFVFVFFGNLGGVTPPIFFPLNGRMALPAIMAICSLLLFISVGISQPGLRPLLQERLFPPGIPWPVYILLTPIELISTFIVRPVTLAIRLLANMIAGHLILSVFFVATGYMLTSMNISACSGRGADLLGRPGRLRAVRGRPAGLRLHDPVRRVHRRGLGARALAKEQTAR